MYFRSHSGKSAQVLLHIVNCSDRCDKVADYAHGENAQQRPAQHRGNNADGGFYKGLNNLHNGGGGKPPDYRKAKADVAAEIEFVVGIIPPSCMKYLFKRPTCYKFKRACYYHRAHKEQKQIVLQRRKRHYDYHKTEAVYGANRTVQKAAVYKLAGFYGKERYLRTPSKKGINKKVPHNIINCHVFPSFCKDNSIFSRNFLHIFFGERRFHGKPLDKRRGGH